VGVYEVLTARTYSPEQPLPITSVYRINTGAPLPSTADSVVMVEDTLLVDTIKGEDGEDVEEKQVEILVQVGLHANTRARGSDVEKGAIVLQKGEIISCAGGEVGTLAFVGRQEVSYTRTNVD
jgi:gephyrin